MQGLLIDNEQYEQLLQKEADRKHLEIDRKRQEAGAVMCCASVSDVDGSAYYAYLYPDGMVEAIISADGLPAGETAKACNCPRKNPFTRQS